MFSGSTRTIAHASKSRWGRVVAVVLLAGIAGAALFAWRSSAANSHPAPVEALSATNDRYTGSIILAAPNSDSCRHYRLDNASGKLTDEGAGNCAGDADATGSGNRFSAIAKSFRTGR